MLIPTVPLLPFWLPGPVSSFRRSAPTAFRGLHTGRVSDVSNDRLSRSRIASHSLPELFLVFRAER